MLATLFDDEAEKIEKRFVEHLASVKPWIRYF